MATARPRIDYDALVKEDRVHGSVYTDPDIFQEEVEKIFSAGRLSPEEYRAPIPHHGTG